MPTVETPNRFPTLLGRLLTTSMMIRNEVSISSDYSIDIDGQGVGCMVHVS